MSSSTEERLEQLEQEVAATKRRYRRLLLLFGVLAVGGSLIAWTSRGPDSRFQSATASFDTITTRSVGLVDSSGTPQASLGMTDAGPVLQFYGPDGQTRLALGAADGSPLLFLVDGAGTNRAELSLTEAGAGLHFYDEAGQKRVMLGTMADVGAGALVYDASGQPRITLAQRQIGPSLSLSDETGETRLFMGAGRTESPSGRTTTYPESSLLMSGPKGDVIWSAPR